MARRLEEEAVKFPGWLVRDKCRRFNKKDDPEPQPAGWISWGKSAHKAVMEMRQVFIRKDSVHPALQVRKHWAICSRKNVYLIHDAFRRNEHQWRTRFDRIAAAMRKVPPPKRTLDLFSARAVDETTKLNLRRGVERKASPRTWALAFVRSYHAFLRMKPERAEDNRAWELCRYNAAAGLRDEKKWRLRTGFGLLVLRSQRAERLRAPDERLL